MDLYWYRHKGRTEDHKHSTGKLRMFNMIHQMTKTYLFLHPIFSQRFKTRDLMTQRNSGHNHFVGRLFDHSSTFLLIQFTGSCAIEMFSLTAPLT